MIMNKFIQDHLFYSAFSNSYKNSLKILFSKTKFWMHALKTEVTTFPIAPMRNAAKQINQTDPEYLNWDIWNGKI